MTENETPVPLSPAERAAQCVRELEEILSRHRCELVARLAAEPVGNDGKALLTPYYRVVALPEEPVPDA